MSILHVNQHEARSIEWWFEQHKAERLDLDPTYQRRGNLWSQYKQAHLIDSILNGYDLPKFYVADFTMGRSTLNVSHKPYAVVDGKQRFGAIFAFLRDDLRLNKSMRLDAQPALEIKGARFSDLVREHPTLAKKFLAFRPVVMSIMTDDADKITEMFIRLNSGEAANSAERRNAQPGPIPVLVRELVDHAFFRRVSFTTKRMADHQLAAKLMLLEYRGGAVDTKAKDIDRFVKQAAEECVPPQFEEPSAAHEANLRKYNQVAERTVEVIERLADAFNDRDSLLSASGRIPVYYLVLRNYPEVTDNFRDFVEKFEAKVIAAMRAERDGGPGADPRFASYYTWSRTQNDQASLRSRYEMMVAELRRRHLI